MKNNFFVPFSFDYEAHWKIRMTSMNAVLLVFQFIMCVKGHRSTLMPDCGGLVPFPPYKFSYLSNPRR
jgi:hypothetical protein